MYNSLNFILLVLCRLTPLYMFVLLLNMWIPYHFFKGPMTVVESETAAVQTCYDTWWTNLLYINNFYPGLPDMVCNV